MVKYKKPLDDNILIRIFHLHAFSLLYRRLFGPISPSDFHDLPSDTEPDKLKQKYISTKASLPKHQQSLNSIIFRMFRWDLLLGIIMSFIVAFLLLQSPLIMKMILQYIEKREVTEYETNKVKQYVWTWLGMFFVKIFFTEMTDRIFFRIGVKIELLLTTLFMEKIVKIPNIEGESNKAEIMNYLTVEIKRVHIFFKKGSWLFSQPPVLVLAIVVIFLEGKEFGMLLFQVLLVMVIINIILDTRMEECHHHKQQFLEKRINTGIELLKQHKQLKTLGWQSMIPDASEFYRKQQNIQNTKYLFYKRINQALLVITTGVFFSIMFYLRYDSTTPTFSNLTLSDVFTITIFIYILKSPIKNIRYTMTYFNSMMKALNSIEQFMNSVELKRVNIISYDCQPGTLECSNIIVRNIDDGPDEEQQMMNLKTLVLKKKLSIEENDVIRHDLIVDMDIDVSSGDKVSIHSDTYEGSTFLAALSGIINCDAGLIMHGGRMTYQNSQIWLMEDSIQANVLIGRPFNKDRLKLVYEVSGLNEELELLLFKERTKVNQLLQLTEGQKRKIMLARTLYTEADIYLLDFPFKGLTFQTSSNIMHRIKIFYCDQTFIVSTFFPHISAFDKSIIFSNGRAIEYSNIDIYRLPQFTSRISKVQSTLLEDKTEVNMEIKNAWNKQKLLQQKVDNRRHIVGKMKSAVRHLLNILRVVGKDKLGEMIEKNQNLKGFAEKRAIMKEDRDSLANTLETLKVITKNVSFRATVAVLVLVSLCEGIKLWMNTLFGPLTEETRADGQRSLLRQYIMLTVVLFLCQISWGILEGKISNVVSSEIAEKMMVSLANASPENIQNKNIYSLAEDSNRDYQEVFMLSHRGLLSYLNIVVLLNVMCLILYLSPSLLLVLILLMAFNILFFRHLLITKRQIFRFKNKITDQSYSAVAELVNGISTLRHQADLPYFVQKQIDFVKDYAVYTLNERYSLHAMKMVSELSTLIMTFWVMNYAVNNKDLFFGYQVPILFTAIYYCVRLSGLVYLIVEDISEIDNLLQVNILPSIQILDIPQEPSEHKLHKPEAWPKNNVLEFERVTLTALNSKVELIRDISFYVESGQRVALFGNIESGTEYIIKLINKEINTGKGIHHVAGKIKIGEQCIETIDQKHVRQQVFRLISDPFIMSGTLRTNIDPYNEYRDRDILRMMDLISLKKYIPLGHHQQNLLEYRITYQNVSFQLKQAIDVIRVLLRKPSILISEMINFPEAQQILQNYLNATTIIYVNPMIKIVKKCNVSKLMFVCKGVLVENGPPSEIMRNKNSVFVKKYLPTHQGNIKERVENIKEKAEMNRERKKSRTFKPEEVEIRE